MSWVWSQETDGQRHALPPVAQGIEHRFLNGVSEVRVLPGAREESRITIGGLESTPLRRFRLRMPGEPVGVSHGSERKASRLIPLTVNEVVRSEDEPDSRIEPVSARDLLAVEGWGELVAAARLPGAGGRETLNEDGRLPLGTARAQVRGGLARNPEERRVTSVARASMSTHHYSATAVGRSRIGHSSAALISIGSWDCRREEVEPVHEEGDPLMKVKGQEQGWLAKELASESARFQQL
jgi:hypothetical protein